MVTLNKTQFKEQFDAGFKETYQKRGTFLFRASFTSETVLTIVAGKLETIKQAKPGDIILRNIEIGSSAEFYIINEETFLKRYDPIYTGTLMLIDGLEWRRAYAKGQVNAFCYIGVPIKFIAPWGEEMICEPGDYLANPIGGAEDDIYRIEKDTFIQTYSIITK
jgi:hypothetical protein